MCQLFLGRGVTIRSCNSVFIAIQAQLVRTYARQQIVQVRLILLFCYNYDKSKYAIRDKTPYEMNLCTDILNRSVLQQVIIVARRDGYAAWPETTVGQMATGSCAVGWVPLAPLQRWCSKCY